MVARLPQEHRRVIAAFNVQGGDGHFYAMMMLADGRVVARRAGRNESGGMFPMHYVRHETPEEFRDEETLRYIAEMKRYKVL
jgi:hypothetical protein